MMKLQYLTKAMLSLSTDWETGSNTRVDQTSLSREDCTTPADWEAAITTRPVETIINGRLHR